MHRHRRLSQNAGRPQSGGPRHRKFLKLDTQRRCDLPEALYHADPHRIVGVPQDPDARDGRNGLPEELEFLDLQLVDKDGDPRHIASGPRQGGRETRPRRVSRHNHDRNGARRSRCGKGGRGGPRHEDISLEIDQLSEECRLLLRLTRDAELDDEVPALDVAEIPRARRNASTGWKRKDPVQVAGIQSLEPSPPAGPRRRAARPGSRQPTR